MMKRLVSVLVLLMLLIPIAVPAHGAPPQGVDRSKIKPLLSERYPVIFTVGKLSFEGQLARLRQPTEEDIQKAIEKTLKQFEKTEAEIGEAAALVEKVTRDNTFTVEDSKRVGKEIREFILKATNLDTPVEVIEHIIGLNDRPLDEFILDTAEDALQDKTVDLILGEVGGPVTKVAEGLMFLSEKYEQDKQKWKDRADAVNANRLLMDFYKKLNENLGFMADELPQGWRISMVDAMNNRYFTFFGIPGNLETWTVNMSLDKDDKGVTRGPEGKYIGHIEIEIKYEMSKFDEGIPDKYQDWIEGLYSAVNEEIGFKWTYNNEGSCTKIYRDLMEPEHYSVHIFTMGRGKIPMDFTDVDDYKIIEIDRTIERSMDHAVEGATFQAKSTMTFKADNKEELLYTYDPQYFKVSIGGRAKTIPEQRVTGEVPWDSSIWDSWDKNDKELEIIFPEK
ncbi:hypothetical protein ACH6CV_01845 [Bacillota bacterium Meth-B3]